MRRAKSGAFLAEYRVLSVRWDYASAVRRSARSAFHGRAADGFARADPSAALGLLVGLPDPIGDGAIWFALALVN